MQQQAGPQQRQDPSKSVQDPSKSKQNPSKSTQEQAGPQRTRDKVDGDWSCTVFQVSFDFLRGRKKCDFEKPI